MRLLSVFSIALLFLLVVGCDGDGDGTTTTTAETTAEETGTVEETRTTVTIDSGSDTVKPGKFRILSAFSLFDTGMLEARVEWNTGPSQLDAGLLHKPGGPTETTFGAESPVTLAMEVTQALLDDSNDWELQVNNPDSDLEATVDFWVRFTPD
jgi:hypothetical protein